MLSNLEDILNDKHFELLAFLITSARGCIDEPKIYGPLRLLDAASKVIEIMEEEGKETEDIKRLKNKIEECIDILMYDEKEFIRLLDDISLDLAKILKKAT
jgi:hypothetical protein